MSFKDICGQPGSDCGTIDFTRERALNNARKAFSGADDHRDTAAAVVNLRACVGTTPKRVMIVGHGKPGLVITGTGRLDNNEDKKIEMANDGIWKPLVDDLKGKITELTFCSCDTGACDKGAKLLAAVAKEVGATVSGFTAMIFIESDGSISCVEDGEWQHAESDGVVPDCIPSPDYPIEENTVSLKLKDQGEYIDLPISAVSELRYFPPEEGEGSKKRKKPKKQKKKPLFTLGGDEAQRLVGTVHFEAPKEFKGAPLAVHTATLEIEFTHEKIKVRRFIVFNDRLLQDESATDTFYFASPDFIKEVRKYLEPPHDEQST